MAYTQHGHHIPNTAELELAFQPQRARCGGIGLCRVCSAEAALYVEATKPEPDAHVEEVSRPVNKLDAYLSTPSGITYIGPAVFRDGHVIFDNTQFAPGVSIVPKDAPPKEGWVNVRRPWEDNHE